VFIKEMETMSRLRHPNIVLFLGATDSLTPIIVTEYAARGSLDKLLATKWTTVMCRFDAPKVWKLHLSFAFQVALGLNHAHKCNYIHGDIKSANLLVTDRMQVRISIYRYLYVDIATDIDTPPLSHPTSLSSHLSQIPPLANPYHRIGEDC
jgi:serine/threonine protein kinase